MLVAQLPPEGTIPALRLALKEDPYGIDLWFNLARLLLQTGDEKGYAEAMRELQKLTPHSRYTVVQGGL